MRPTRIAASPHPSPRPSTRRWRRPKPGLAGKLVGDLGLLVAVLLLVAPFAFAVLIAIRPDDDVARDPLGFPTRLTIDNVVRALSQMRYGQGVLNTVVILAVTSVLTVLLGSLASYPLSRIGKGWTRMLYLLFIVGTAVPIWVLVAPLYLFMRDVGLLGTHLGVILIYTAGLLPIAIFFYTSFIRQVPIELEEAAAIDGAGPLRTFLTIVFPLLAPMTVTLITFISLSVWNDLVIPLLFLSGTENGTVMSNAFALLDPLVVRPTTLFPAALLGVIPLVVLFALLQRYVISGLTQGGVK